MPSVTRFFFHCFRTRRSVGEDVDFLTCGRIQFSIELEGKLVVVPLNSTLTERKERMKFTRKSRSRELPLRGDSSRNQVPNVGGVRGGGPSIVNVVHQLRLISDSNFRIFSRVFSTRRIDLLASL